MEEHGVGIVKKPARLLAPDEGYFAEHDESELSAEDEEPVSLTHEPLVGA